VPRVGHGDYDHRYDITGDWAGVLARGKHMSWEIFVVKFAGDFTSVNEAAEDEHLLDLGSLEAVTAAVTAVFPETDWTEPGWGSWKDGEQTVGFDIGNENPVETLALHIEADDSIVAKVLQLCADNGWHAAESGDGEFLDALADPAEGLRLSRQHP
jgi:hypothetical protein